MDRWGTIPDWIGAIGTSGAFIAGLLLIKRQLGELRALEDERRIAGARRVSAWCMWDSDVSPARYHLYVRNGASDPVYRCQVEVRISDGGLTAGFYFPMIPPEHTSDALVEPSDLGVAAGAYPAAPDPFAEVSLSFEDAQDRLWHRAGDGALDEVAPE